MLDFLRIMENIILQFILQVMYNNSQMDTIIIRKIKRYFKLFSIALIYNLLKKSMILKTILLCYNNA